MINFVVTTSFKKDKEKIEEAKNLAVRFGVPYLSRDKASIQRIIGETDGALVVYKQNLVFVHADGREFSFHPDTAVFRIRARKVPLLELLGNEKLQILDTTMGLARDSLVMAYVGHDVLALESSPLIHLIVSRGLKTFETGNHAIDQAMRRIETKCVDSLDFLKAVPDQSVDVIYCDPMFSEVIPESDNLAGLANLANPARLTPEFLEEAKRVARKAIVIKAHYRDTVFEDFGFERQVRPNQKFHYGIIALE